jgi:alpha(1,3/1,4) fucosyltransferase
MMRRKVRLKFVDFWDNQNNNESLFYKLLSLRFEIEISDNPDYIVYSVFGYEHLKYNCVRIFFTGEQVSPDFDVADYAIGFDYLSFGDRFIRFPLFALNYSPQNLQEIDKNYNETFYKSFLNREFCSFVYSNSKATSPRDQFFRLLHSRKYIKSAGRHLNNVGYSTKDKVEFESNFKFSIAFENASYPGYTTEKILDSFAAGTIPIYYGDSLVYNDFNKGSFINLHDFDSFEEAINYILELDDNPNLLMKYYETPKIKNHVLDYERRILDFFDHIFSQSKDSVYRRPHSNRSIMKIRSLLLLSKIYKIKLNLKIMIGPLKKLVRKIRMVFKL